MSERLRERITRLGFVHAEMEQSEMTPEHAEVSA